MYTHESNIKSSNIYVRCLYMYPIIHTCIYTYTYISGEFILDSVATAPEHKNKSHPRYAHVPGGINILVMPCGCSWGYKWV